MRRGSVFSADVGAVLAGSLLVLGGVLVRSCSGCVSGRSIGICGGERSGRGSSGCLVGGVWGTSLRVMRSEFQRWGEDCMHVMCIL